MRSDRLACAICLGLVWLPATMASAQSATTGAVAGVVKDPSGAVLPGVTVEATSPALIEKSRTAVTDTNGQYRIVDLRPGTYVVTFTLSGFSIFKRENVELTTAFTATVNAELQVGSLEETVVVTGAGSLVDVQNVHSQNVLSREILDTLPNNRTYQGFAALTLGAMSSPDVGGNKGDAPVTIQIHGTRPTDGKLTIDGMNFSHIDNQAGGSATRVYLVNQTAMQEVTLATGVSNPENESGGVSVNYVPRDGGNRFNVSSLINFTNGDLQSSNLDSRLRARGLRSAPRVKSVYDVGAGVGGPIVGDRLWFYNAFRDWHSKEIQPGTYFNSVQDTLFYEPDLSRPGFSDYGGWDESLRLTWQIAAKHRLAAYGSFQRTGNWGLGISPTTAPEAGLYIDYNPNALIQGTWTYPATERLLFEAGTTWIRNPTDIDMSYLDRTDSGMHVAAETISVTDVGLGLTYRNSPGVGLRGWRSRRSPFSFSRFSTSYVTGTHNFKTGVSVLSGSNTADNFGPDISYTFRNRAAIGLRQFALPRPDRADLRQFALYVQDQWTVIRKLTLNLGGRFDYLKSSVPVVQSRGGRFLPATEFPAVTNVPNWKDIVPRLGVAYDLFGDGKTAVKGAIGKYVLSHGPDIALASSPAGALSADTSRTWNDINGNYVPECDLSSPAANGECGAMENRLFGTVNLTRRYADDVRLGWGARDFNWQAAVTVDHELRPGTAANLEYHRTWYGNMALTDNLAVTPADHSPYCITAPTDPRLPGGGGNQLCGLYDINPAVFGRVDNLVTQSSNYGKRREVFNGLDIGMKSRFGHDGQLAAGVSFGQTVTDTCYVVDSPQEVRPGFCRVKQPWWDGHGQLKFSAIYPLPWAGLQASLVYQNLPGAPISANYVATSADVRSSLGRNLASGPNGTVTVPLLPPNTEFEDRLSQLDVRFTKIFRARGIRVQGMFDVYNLLNANTVLGVNPAFGANWLQPTGVLAPRLFKFQAQLDF